MTIFARRALGTLTVAAALLAAGCSSSGGGTASTSPSAPAGSPSPSASSSAAPASPSPSATGTPADPATTKAVSTAYATFFSSTSSVARSQAALQHGSAFHQVLAAESNTSQANTIKVDVTKVNRISSDLAFVTFTLHAGAVALPNSHGYAVKEGGHWKVAAQTFCNLLQLENNTPPPCKDTSITALPH